MYKVRLILVVSILGASIFGVASPASARMSEGVDWPNISATPLTVSDQVMFEAAGFRTTTDAQGRVWLQTGPGTEVSLPDSKAAQATGKTMTKAEYQTFNKGVVTTSGKPPVVSSMGNNKLSKLGGALSKAGSAMAGAAGVDVIYSLTAGPLSSLLGTSTSGDLVCDVASAFSSTYGCETTPAPGYVPNSDITGIPLDGYAGDVVFDSANATTSGTIQLTGIQETPSQVIALFSIVSCAGPKNQNSSTPGMISARGLGFRENLSGWTQAGGSSSGAGVVQSRNENCQFNNGSGALAVAFEKSTRVGYPTMAIEFANGLTYPVPAAPVYNASSTPVTNQVLRTTRHGVYYLQGTAQRVALDEEKDPLRVFKAIYTCSDLSVRTVTSEQFRESADVYPAPPGTDCGSGYPIRVAIYLDTVGTSISTLVYDWDMPESMKTAYANQAEECPTHDCILDLRRVVDTSTEISCFAQPDLCVNWYTSPTKSTDFACYYADNLRPLSSCTVYRPTFNPTQKAQGELYGNPVTGATPTTSDPGTPAQSNPNTNTSTSNIPGQASTTTGQCYPSGWGMLNPLEWVVKPLVCLFAPTQDFSFQVATLKANLETRAPFSVASTFTPILQGFASGRSSCNEGSGLADFTPLGADFANGSLKIPCQPTGLGVWGTTLYAGMGVFLVVTTAFALRSLTVSAMGGRG